MFADPFSVTINSVAKSLVKVNQDQYSSEYRLRSSTDELRLAIRNTNYTDKKRGVSVDRHNVELVQEVFPVSPATKSTIRKTYMVMENDKGDSLADPVYLASALLTALTASSNAALTKLTNFES
jgi:hypothetical protein